MILLFIVFCPLLAAFAVLAGAPARLTSLAAAFLNLAATVAAFARFERSHEGFAFVSSLPISREWGLNFTLGVDGLSLIMILLTAMTLAAVWFATPTIAGHPGVSEDGEGPHTGA